MTATIEAWIGGRCRSAAERYMSRDAALAAVGGRAILPSMPLVEVWFFLLALWVAPAWLISIGELILREALLASRLRMSGVIEGMSGVMLVLDGAIMAWSTSALMRDVLAKIITVEFWVWSSIAVGFAQLLALRFASCSKRSIVTACSFVWWATMAMRLYSAYGLLLTHSQLLTMTAATAIALFILRFQTEMDNCNGQPER